MREAAVVIFMLFVFVSPAQAYDFTWPTPGYKDVTSEYGMRTNPVTGVYKLHDGMDIGAPEGTEILAVADAEVIESGDSGGWGKRVTIRIDANKDIVVLCAHMSQIAPGIEVGKKVKKGDIIGYVGSTGFSTGAHLHISFYTNGVVQGESEDPAKFLSGAVEMAGKNIEEVMSEAIQTVTQQQSQSVFSQNNSTGLFGIRSGNELIMSYGMSIAVENGAKAVNTIILYLSILAIPFMMVLWTLWISGRVGVPVLGELDLLPKIFDPKENSSQSKMIQMTVSVIILLGLAVSGSMAKLILKSIQMMYSLIN